MTGTWRTRDCPLLSQRATPRKDTISPGGRNCKTVQQRCGKQHGACKCVYALTPWPRCAPRPSAKEARLWTATSGPRTTQHSQGTRDRSSHQGRGGQERGRRSCTTGLTTTSVSRALANPSRPAYVALTLGEATTFLGEVCGSSLDVPHRIANCCEAPPCVGRRTSSYADLYQKANNHRSRDAGGARHAASRDAGGAPDATPDRVYPTTVHHGPRRVPRATVNGPPMYKSATTRGHATASSARLKDASSPML